MWSIKELKVVGQNWRKVQRQSAINPRVVCDIKYSIGVGVFVQQSFGVLYVFKIIVSYAQGVFVKPLCEVLSISVKTVRI